MTINDKNRPINIRDGALKAAIWTNEHPEHGSIYSVTITRSYKDQNDQWQDSSSFSSSHLLRVARLTEMAYDRIAELRQSDNGKPEDAQVADA